MIGISGDARIFLFSAPTDMRKSFHGLSKVVYAHNGIPHDGGKDASDRFFIRCFFFCKMFGINQKQIRVF